MSTTMTEHERAQRLMAMGQMAASLAHEIRNPLGSMELFCTLLKKDLGGQPQLLQVAEQIHLGIRTLDRIISNCLQFARDVNPRKKRITDVRPLLDEALSYVQGRAEELKVRVSAECVGYEPVSIDPYLLNQVLLNLLLNAIDAAGENGTVVLRSEQQAGEWTIVIEDSGPGITDEAKRQMFDPFFTTKQGGTGLGLTIVHSIVSAHEGSIDFVSEAGRGTRAIIRFPQSDKEGRANVTPESSADACVTGGQ